MSASQHDEKQKGLTVVQRILLVLFGFYLLVGAAYTFATGRWFIGFPPQLDIAYLFTGSSTVGAYIEAAIACVLGLISLALSSAKGGNHNAN